MSDEKKEGTPGISATPAVNSNVLDLNGFRKKKVPTKTELLKQTIDKEEETNKKFETIQIILNNFNKRLKDDEDKFSNDIMQSIILILALKEAITQKLKIDDNEWNDIVQKVTKKLAEEREKEFDKQNNLITVNRPVKTGDFVVVSFYGTIDGKSFEGGSSNGALISVGSKVFLEEFENSLIDRKKDEIYNTLIKFPINYPVANLANKEANFEVKILSIKEKIPTEKPPEENSNGPTAA